MRTKIAQIALALLYLFSANLLAENSTTIPGYKIHHNALPTAALDSEVAKAYQIQRSKYRGLLNVSVIKTQAGTTGSPAHAIVQAYATNILGQRIDIPMREVKETGAIYYLGEFRITDRETLNFSIKVKPQGEPRFYKAQLKQQFFID